MPRRHAETPPLDLVPVMGLVTVLIAMLLLGTHVVPVGTVDTRLPGF
jgi:hypothetical protein